MTSIRTLITSTALLPVAALTACGDWDDDDAPAFNENGIASPSVKAPDRIAEIDAAEAGLSAEMREAAREPGDLACGFALVPDHRAGRITDGTKNVTFNTDATPDEVAAFYRIAGKAKSGEVSVGGVPGLTEVEAALPDLRRCTIVAQAQPTGDTNVTVRFGS